MRLSFLPKPLSHLQQGPNAAKVFWKIPLSDPAQAPGRLGCHCFSHGSLMLSQTLNQGLNQGWGWGRGGKSPDNR